MASTSSSTKPTEESKVLPTNQQYPEPFDLSGDVAKCSKLEVTDCNPMSSVPLQPSCLPTLEDVLRVAPPAVGKWKHSCPVCGQVFKWKTAMRKHHDRKHCNAPIEKGNEYSMPEARRKNDSAKDSEQETHVSTVDQLAHNDSGVYTLDSIPIMTQSLEDSSQKTDSDETSSTADIYISNRKNQIIDSIVLTVMQWLRLKLDVWRKNAGGSSNSASGISKALSGSHLRTGLSDSNNCGNKKRKAAERDDPETDNDGEGGKREDPRSHGMSIQRHEDPKYACPYFKYNPAKYKDWRTCPGPGWSDVHRVKEHLYRRHRQPQHRCARCWQPFLDEQSIIDHQRTDESCPLREMEYIEGFDVVQERSLRSRKRANQKLSETEKWRRVFKILFPHVLEDDIPSPFYDYSQVSQKEDACHPESGYLAQCEQYMLREVPQRLRQALGRELDRDLTIVEENLRRRAGDWVKTLLEEAFQELRQIRHLGSPAQRPEPSNDISAPAEGPQLPTSELPSVVGTNLHFEEEGETWLDTFDFDSFDPSAVLGQLQYSFDNGGLIEDLLRPGEDGAGEATKQSDSGYVSNSPE
ncbi:Nicotinate-nucleotide diphosphorylase [Fusarium acutatum]|uniref:Nicotinate-nucleotide diphosphorylase n=1 Tax=Fusarium acutatum TaxID=78861 RepID=A0A8H4K0A6_9HYPO|nr:Nicotinate-nucleotide diphosphorylase [Fusarium acutatum]